MSTPDKKQIDPRFLKRLKTLIGDEKPYAWAARVGISKGALTRMLNEASVPAAAILKRIAEKTGANIHWLITGEGEKFASYPQMKEQQGSYRKLGAGAMTEEERDDWLRALDHLLPEDRARLRAVADTIASARSPKKSTG